VNLLLPLAAVIPLGGAPVCLAVRSLAARRVVVALAASAVGVLGVWGLVSTGDGTVVVSHVGGFPAPFAISFAMDTFSALMLVVFAVVGLASGAFAALRGEDASPRYHTAMLALLGAASGAVLTADLFNLFVWIEVMLLASYVLLTMGATSGRVRAAGPYVATNLLGSTVFLIGVALVYGAAGSVDLGSLVGAATASGGVAVGGVLIVVALGVKAALVPTYAWLPRAYPAASAGVAALFSGTLTKVGLVAMFRVVTVLFDGGTVLATPLLIVAGLTMVVGVAGAVGRTSIRGILSFHMVSQMGYPVMALGLGSTVAMTAGVFFLVQYIGVKTALFLVSGTVEADEGSDELDELGGLARRRPALAAVFLIVALSLAGIPPLSGFVGKFALVQAAFAQGGYVIGGVAIAVSAFTLLSMVKIWNGAFWGSAPPDGRPQGDRRRGLIVPAAALAAVTVLLGVGAQGLWVLAQRAAQGLADAAVYGGALGR
jgi:multicomponent Na+:H+ antiporter subunit D